MASLKLVKHYPELLHVNGGCAFALIGKAAPFSAGII